MTTTILPNPKPTTATNTVRPPWYRFYAMFSEQFVEQVLAEADLPAGSSVLDPWLGVGTTTAVAAAAGFRGTGVDISPAMIAIAKGRCLPRPAATNALAAVEDLAGKAEQHTAGPGDALLGWFGPFASREFRGWERLIRSSFTRDQDSKESGFLLTALFEAAYDLVTGHRSRNPTWFRQPSLEHRAEAQPGRVTRVFLDAIRRRLPLCRLDEAPHEPDIRIGTSATLPLPSSFSDLILTSPPYCTRIDYAITTRLELAILGHDEHTLGDLRDKMMGTTTIRPKCAMPALAWGRTCNRFLTSVYKHPSKASKTYYYKTYLQYFDDLCASLRQIDRCAKPGAHIVIVVQDSRYKGILVDLAQIVSDMAQLLGWKPVRRLEYEITRTMRRVNTRSRAYRADASSSETVLWFNASDAHMERAHG